MKQIKIMDRYNENFFIPKFVWLAIVFCIIFIIGVYGFKVYSATSSSVSINVGPSNVSIEMQVSEKVNSAVSSIESATSTARVVNNELFPKIENIMIVNNVGQSYIDKWEKGKSDMQGIAWLLDDAQKNLKRLNLGNEIKVEKTVNNLVSSIETATSTVNAVDNDLFPLIENMIIVYKIDPLYLQELEKGRNKMQELNWQLEEVQESLKTLYFGSITAK